MTLKKPPRLKRGDRIAAVSLSWGGPGAVPHRYEAGKRQFEQAFGVEVVETRHALRDKTWLSNNPQARADDLMEAFADKDIHGIVSTIGGSDSVRILPLIDTRVIQQNPKVFLGYSDTTITHFACYQAGLVSFYGPAIMSGFAENSGMFPYMTESVRKTLFSSDPVGVVHPNTDGWTVEHLEWSDPANQEIPRTLSPAIPWRFLQGEGIARGHLLGGCAEVLEFMKGTKWWPTPAQWHGAILFLETSEDAPPPTYLEYWMRNYGSQGILQNLAGIIIGRPGGGVQTSDFEKYDRAVLRVVREELGLTRLPVITCMDFGHTDPMFVLPYGITAEIDCILKQFSIVESAVL